MRPYDTVIISDLHLGARNARHREVLAFLDQIETDRLVLNGDVFEDSRLRGLSVADIEVIDALRRYATHTHVEWLLGNHDPPETWFTGLLGIEPRNELELHVDGARYLVCHGHQWDCSLHWPSAIIGGAEAVYRGCQWIDPTHRLARFLKHKSKCFVKAVKSLQRHAHRTAVQRGYAGVILGHTHVLGDSDYQGIHYLNSGCWTESPAGFVGIRDDEARAYQWLPTELIPLHERPIWPPPVEVDDVDDIEPVLVPT